MTHYDCSHLCSFCNVETYEYKCPLCLKENIIDDDEMQGIDGDEEGKAIRCANCKEIFYIFWSYQLVFEPHSLVDVFDEDEAKVVIEKLSEEEK